MAKKTFEIKDSNVNGARSISLLFVPVFACKTDIENILRANKKDNEYIFRYDVTIDSDTFNSNIYKLNIRHDAEFNYSCIIVEKVFNTVYCKRGSGSDIATFINEAVGMIYKDNSYAYHIYDAFDNNKDELCKIIRNTIANL